MPGPPPKHPSARVRRNNPSAGFTSLPAGGLDAKKRPPWPLRPDPEMVARLELLQDKITQTEMALAEAEDGRTKGRLRKELNQAELGVAVLKLKIEQGAEEEVALWDLMWSSPQAVLWDASVAFTRTVALFVRWQVRAEQGDLKAATEARQLSDRLGLNPLALQKLKAEIENAEAAEDRGKARRERTAPKKKPPGGDDPRLTLVG